MSDVRARELDDAFLRIVADWARGGPGCDEAAFEALALAIFAYQMQSNAPYARFAAASGEQSGVRRWQDIPAVPAGAFKDATLATFDVNQAELVFETSGTTQSATGKHYIQHARLYDAALLAGFDRFMLPDRAKLRYLNLVPNPRYRVHSSLGYMMGHVSVLRGEGKAAYFLEDDSIDGAAFTRALAGAIKDGVPVCIAGTAFALAALLEMLESERRTFVAPNGSRLMETGGFKGRARVVERAELYARLELTFGIPQSRIVAEYGMTELVSQYYDTPASRTEAVRLKAAPPWLRTLVVDAEGRALPEGEVGFLRHVDLGNRSSAIAVDTEDRGYRTPEGLVLLGRALDAPPRGCSLDAEELLAAKR